MFIFFSPLKENKNLGSIKKIKHLNNIGIKYKNNSIKLIKFEEWSSKISLRFNSSQMKERFQNFIKGKKTNSIISRLPTLINKNVKEINLKFNIFSKKILTFLKIGFRLKIIFEPKDWFLDYKSNKLDTLKLFVVILFILKVNKVYTYLFTFHLK